MWQQINQKLLVLMKYFLPANMTCMAKKAVSDLKQLFVNYSKLSRKYLVNWQTRMLLVHMFGEVSSSDKSDVTLLAFVRTMHLNNMPAESTTRCKHYTVTFFARITILTHTTGVISVLLLHDIRPFCISTFLQCQNCLWTGLWITIQAVVSIEYRFLKTKSTYE